MKKIITHHHRLRLLKKYFEKMFTDGLKYDIIYI